jgi:hypothetical protein
MISLDYIKVSHSAIYGYGEIDVTNEIQSIYRNNNILSLRTSAIGDEYLDIIDVYNFLTNYKYKLSIEEKEKLKNMAHHFNYNKKYSNYHNLVNICFRFNDQFPGR